MTSMFPWYFLHLHQMTQVFPILPNSIDKPPLKQLYMLFILIYMVNPFLFNSNITGSNLPIVLYSSGINPKTTAIVLKVLV